MTISQEKFDSMIETAKTDFWQGVANAIPAATTGDVSPDVYYLLERAMREALTEWVDNNDPTIENKTVEILLHNIEYWYHQADETVEVDDADIEHIAYQISQGIAEGELCTGEDEWRGWWTIKK